MIKKFTLLFSLLLFPQLDFAQTILGIIIDEEGEPVEYANIVQYQLPDSVFLAATISDIDGKFSLNAVPNVNSILRISHLGYDVAFVKIEDCSVIKLTNTAYSLNEITVMGNSHPFASKNGNIVANVAGTILEREMNTMELLKKIPGIIEKDGDIKSFIGGTPTIYIDGRKVQSLNEVKNLDVKSIKNVELNTNPGAEYDASTGAVLSIKTKERLRGTSLMVESMLKRNHFWTNDNTISASYSNEKISLSGQFGFSDYRQKNEQDMDMIIYSDTIWDYKNQISTIKNSSKETFCSFTVDYKFSDKHSAGIKYDGIFNKDYESLNQPCVQSANNILKNSIESYSTEDGKRYSHYLNAYYKLKPNEKFRSEIYIDYFKKNVDKTQNVYETSAESSNTTNIQTDANDDLFAIDSKFYIEPNAKYQLLVGAEYSYVGSKTDLTYSPQIFNDTHSKDKENKYGGYVRFKYNNQSGLNLYAGLRYEIVKAQYQDLLNNEKDISKTYGNLFPSAGISYIAGNVSQNLNYSRSIVRPAFSLLSGRTLYINKYMYQEGNPELKPQYSHRIQYSLNYKSLYFSVQYQHKKDAIQNVLYNVGENANVVKSTYENIRKSSMLQAMINYNHKFGFYVPSLTLGYRQNFMDITVADNLKTITKPYCFIVSQNTFNITDNLYVDLSYEFNGKSSYGFTTVEPIHILDAKINLSLFNKTLLLGLSFDDILNTNIGKFYGQVYNVYMYNKDFGDRRAVSFNAIWYFNNYKNKYKGQSASDEINRL